MASLARTGLRFAVVLGVALLALVDAASARPVRPNIVYVLTDDLSWDLLRFMPQVRRMQREGMTFRQFIVSDSMCCSSRATILTGQFPHNTHVLGNMAPHGGYSAFRLYGARRRSAAIAIRRAGYRTALMGKYLNGYQPYEFGPDPGWDEWLGSSYAYGGFGYAMSDNGRPVTAGYRPRDYVTDVLARRAVRFIRGSVRPFFLTIASYAPHSPYTPAPRHRRLFRRLELPSGGAFDDATTDPPEWLGARPPLDASRREALRRHYRMRARSVQAVDELIGRIRAALRRARVRRNTFVLFSSDNGYHLGQHRLAAGKRTAFDHDIRVPLVVVGPGVRAGATTSRLTGTVDLAPTFAAWARARMNPARDGHSLMRLLEGRRVRRWRRALLIEHTREGTAAGDPDAQGRASGKPDSYTALRTRHTTYVEYANGEREFYDRRRDPPELHNRAARLTRGQRTALSAALQRYRRCAGRTACWAAGRGSGAVRASS
jgi:arylsulfatase A-like enzyme